MYEKLIAFIFTNKECLLFSKIMPESFTNLHKLFKKDNFMQNTEIYDNL